MKTFLLDENLLKIIKIDVKRSFNNHKDFPKQILENILISSAVYFHDSISYC
jgi:hypothetical protein